MRHRLLTSWWSLGRVTLISPVVEGGVCPRRVTSTHGPPSGGGPAVSGRHRRPPRLRGGRAPLDADYLVRIRCPSRSSRTSGSGQRSTSGTSPGCCCGAWRRPPSRSSSSSSPSKATGTSPTAARRTSSSSPTPTSTSGSWSGSPERSPPRRGERVDAGSRCWRSRPWSSWRCRSRSSS